MASPLDAGLQLHLPTYRDLSLRRLLELSQSAHAAGIEQLWVTDNLQSRNAFVVLAALAAALPVKLGMAVLVQYFRSPVDVADAIATISELMDGRELSLGISRGNPSTPRLLRSPKPVSILRETAEALQRLLTGDPVRFADYASLAAYFNLEADHAYRLNFHPNGNVRLYCGGNAPRSLTVAGTSMHGIVFGWTFLAAAHAGRLGSLLNIADAAARAAGRPAPLPRVAEIKLYVSRDDRAAREFCRRATASRLVGLFDRGYTSSDFESCSIPAADIDRLRQAAAAGAAGAELSVHVTDAMLDTFFIAGDPARCRERLQAVGHFAREHAFHQLMFSELGPDVELSLPLLCDEILPAASLPQGR
jgi:5,10-methylenetetrahydromethanopterin reductase